MLGLNYNIELVSRSAKIGNFFGTPKGEFNVISNQHNNDYSFGNCESLNFALYCYNNFVKKLLHIYSSSLSELIINSLLPFLL